MPWNEVNLMRQRQRFIEKLLQPGVNVSMLCKRYNISRKTAYKWLSRYKAEALETLADQSKAPRHRPLKIALSLERKIVELHEHYPYWGPRKLRYYLQNTQEDKKLPAVSTFARVLKRNGCDVIKTQKSPSATQRFERSQPNELWQMDFKGSVMTGNERCYPLTILDDYSRYSIGLEACSNQTGETVKRHLVSCFEEFGLPEQINVDNGAPWGNSLLEGATRLVVWLSKWGIRVSHSTPYHPQTNGKDERFHRTLKLEVLHERSYPSCQEIQRAFDQWRHLYNYKRPHDALKGQAPYTRYRISSRSFTNPPEEVGYESDEIVRKVHSDTGMIRFKGHRYRVGKGWGGEYVALRETAQADEWSVFFMNTFIKKINVEKAL